MLADCMKITQRAKEGSESIWEAPIKMRLGTVAGESEVEGSPDDKAGMELPPQELGRNGVKQSLMSGLETDF